MARSVRLSDLFATNRPHDRGAGRAAAAILVNMEQDVSPFLVPSIRPRAACCCAGDGPRPKTRRRQIIPRLVAARAASRPQQHCRGRPAIPLHRRRLPRPTLGGIPALSGGEGSGWGFGGSSFAQKRFQRVEPRSQRVKGRLSSTRRRLLDKGVVLVFGQVERHILR
jgi:hypothetical protein